MKLILKILAGLFLLGVIVVVTFFLSLDTILKVLIEHNIRQQTGMDAEIGKFHMGLLDPVLQVEDLKIYNPSNFDGTPFVDIPEIHVEYDKDALRDGRIHLTMLRFNLGELDIVKNDQGQTNIFEMGVTVPTQDDVKHNRGMNELKKRTGLDFQGIDAMTVSVGTLKYVDLKDPHNDVTQKVGIENVPMHNVKTEADLAGLMVLVGLKSGNFFDMFMPTNSGMGTLQQMGF